MSLITKYIANKYGKDVTLSHDQFCELMIWAQSGNIEARNILIERNLGLIGKFASRSNYLESPSIGYDDLFQEGVKGLIRAIELFDLSKGHRFSTYATIWIRKLVNRYIEDHRYAVRQPVWSQNLAKKYKSIKEKYGEQDEDFYIRMIALENGKSVEAIEAGLKMSVHLGVRMESLTKGSGNDENDEEWNLEDYLDIVNEAEETSQYDIDLIKKIMGNLPDNLRFVLDCRSEGMTFETIGELLGISRERVRQMEEDAALRMRVMIARTPLPPCNAPRH